MIVKTYNVLILDTKNSARSIMAEALFNTMGEGVYKAYSAGSSPARVVNRFAIEEIKNTAYPVKYLRSKSWHEYTKASAPRMNFVITICESVAKEKMPAWQGKPMFVHWHFDDPNMLEGTFEEKKVAFKTVFEAIKNKIDLFTRLPLAHLDQKILDSKMAEWHK